MLASESLIVTAFNIGRLNWNALRSLPSITLSFCHYNYCQLPRRLKFQNIACLKFVSDNDCSKSKIAVKPLSKETENDK